ncbi:MAG: M23 family metallopeptidase [Bacteroidota bacterium]|nr:M23 family metallopeptidase [Bacteroidota bacterium]MEC7955401.1 M23 family metallopeptidase [Bacteroidota bacterium]MEC7999009.1 M23 family metallopeptidase [Bacteroidota bacterium]MEC8030315.1 M23 family metallopeptidase [Bacteroidota bacterium]MEC8406993.1 M23 family metallopeptidase [Bacteroidota bacterium]
MAKKNKKASKFRDWFNRAQEKKRIIILDVDNYEEKRSYTTSKFNVFIILSFFTILLGFLTFALISYSSLKNLIPGYPNPTQQQEIKNKSIIIDQKLTELLSKTEKEKSYINNVMQILNGSIPINEKDTSWKKINPNANSNTNEISSSEKSMREKVQNREKFDIDVIPGGALKSEVLPELLLFPPIKGEITNKMNISSGHFGVDIIAPKNEAVSSILNGTIIYHNWSPTDGHVVHIQHKKNLISIYKHNSEILKEIGDFVESGEPIAIVGNSGEHSTGPHLHFELWHNGYPLDPEIFINFN